MRGLALLAALAVLVLGGCTGKDAVNQNNGGSFVFDSATKVGTVIPAGERKTAGSFTAALLNGASYDLGAEQGHVVLLNYWATWCPPCRTEMPGFDALYRKLHGPDVAFVGVDMKDTVSSAKSFVQQNEISYPIVSDEPGKTLVALGKHIPAKNLPFTILLDRHRRVAAVYIKQLSAGNLEPVLGKLAAES